MNISQQNDALRLPLGTILHERYKIKKTLAAKPIGTIYLAEDVKVTAKLWVVKECFPPPVTNEIRLKYETLFHQEAERYKELFHPHIAKILDSFTESNREYLVMEYVEGASVEAISQMSVNPLDDRQVMQWMLQVCQALEFLHSQPEPILFRDLCPRYIMLSSQEEVKLVNFGFDRILYPESRDLIPSEYIAPEIEIKGYSFASDIYSIGAAAYALLTKHTPLSPPKQISEYNEIANPIVTQLVLKCLEQDPELRFPSIQELRKEIELFLYPPEPVTVSQAPLTFGQKTGRITEAFRDFGGLIWKRLIINYGFLFNPTMLLIVLIIFGAFSIYRHHISYTPHPFTKITPLAYVLCQKSSIALVNTTPGQEEVLYTLPLSGGVDDIAALKDSIFLTSSESKTLSKIAIADTTFSPIAKLEFAPSNLTIDPNGLFAYIVIPSHRILTVIAITNGLPVAILPTGQLPGPIAIDKRREELFIGNTQSKTISIIDLSRKTLINTLQPDGTPSNIIISPDERFLLVSNDKEKRVSVYDLETKVLLHEIPMERSGPHSLVFSPGGDKLYISGLLENKVTIYEGFSLRDTNKIKQRGFIAIDQPISIAVTPDGKRLLVCHGKSYLAFLDSETLQWQTNVKVGKQPTKVITVP